MLFLKDEKVFSLAKTAAAVPHGDMNALFAEFYCYLLVVGLFREGEGVAGVHFNTGLISDNEFYIPSGSYRPGLAQMLTKGLRDRYLSLYRHPNLTALESDVLTSLNGIFSNERGWYTKLTGKDLVNIAIAREFNDDMLAIAHYVSVMFGQYDYAELHSVPSLYLSVFGNIHLSKQESMVLHEPTLRYGLMKDGNQITALWSLMSALADSFVRSIDGAYPGDELGEMLSGLGFLTNRNEFEKSVPIPSFASALYIQRYLGVEGPNPVALSAAFYQNFLYGSMAEQIISRQPLLMYILHVMMEKMGETYLRHLFMSESPYRKLATTTSLTNKIPKRPRLFQFALESLDSDVTDEDQPQDEPDLDTENPDDSPSLDPALDPTAPPMAVPPSPPVSDKDTIGLISFDKSGEGVDEDLYRAAVVALNDRLRSDDTLPIMADVKDFLDYWVNGYLYRTAISATKDQIKHLNLQQYLKNVSVEG